MDESDYSGTLFTESELKARVKELGAQITEDYKGKEPFVICVLKGASVFYADLIREINLPIEIDFIAIASYGNSSVSSGEVKLVKDINKPLVGRDVILVEDIVDSGRSFTYMKELLGARHPASLKFCACFDKPSRRKVQFEADYIGFEVPDEFLVGYGLDYDQKYRNLKDVKILAPHVYMK